MIPKVVLIAGPTASGKSAIAVELALALDGVIINADSMQVYRELEVITARPGPADTARVTHHLYGHVPASRPYSAGRFIAEAGAAIAAAGAAGKVAIVVGGTGLYFKALTEGLAHVPAIEAAIRAHWREEARRLGGPSLHGVLAVRDPIMAARLAPTDAQRITRALEVIDATGRSLAAWQADATVATVPAAGTVRVKIDRPREELARRATERFDAMMAAGALDEVRRLVALDLDPGLPAMRALGVAPLARHLAGKATLDDAVMAAVGETRQYIKRQQTWMKRNMIAWNSVMIDDNCVIGDVIETIIALVDGSH